MQCHTCRLLVGWGPTSKKDHSFGPSYVKKSVSWVLVRARACACLSRQASLGVSDASFHKGAPFLPFQQLLGCLPAGSKQFLPPQYQWLMTHKDSPLLDFFPADFKVGAESRGCV